MLIKRSLMLAGHRTSVALEGAFWAVLTEIAETRDLSLAGLVNAIDQARPPGQPLASALRLNVLSHVQALRSQAR